MNGLEQHLLLLQIAIIIVAVVMYFVIRKGPGRSANRLLGMIIGLITVVVLVFSSITYRYYLRSIKYELEYEDVTAIYLNGYIIDDKYIQKSIIDQFNNIDDVVRNADGNEADNTENWLIFQLRNGKRIQVLDMENGEVQVHLGFSNYSEYDSYYTGSQELLSGLISGEYNYKDVEKSIK